MDNFKIIYKILKILETAMNLEEFDKSLISAESLGLSLPLWSRIMKMLVDNNYITGVVVTIKGLENIEVGKYKIPVEKSSKSGIIKLRKLDSKNQVYNPMDNKYNIMNLKLEQHSCPVTSAYDDDE